MTRILIVDDDPKVTEQISTVLDSIGFESLFLLEPEYLIQMLSKKKIDLILMDIHMPGIDGLTLLKQLKHHGSDFFMRSISQNIELIHTSN